MTHNDNPVLYVSKYFGMSLDAKIYFGYTLKANCGMPHSIDHALKSKFVKSGLVTYLTSSVNN
jgi:hypothetical protein